MQWKPLLTNGAATRAWSAIQDIASALEADPEEPTLASGAAGTALFWSYYGASTDDETAYARAERLLDRVCTMVPVLDTSLYSGWAGVGWVFEHLAPAEDSSDDHPNTEIDTELANALSVERWTGDYDLISGLTGVALYALERLPRSSAVAALDRIVTYLEQTASHRDTGLTWHTRPELLPDWYRPRAPDGWDNLGVAHGVPGTINVLARIARCQMLATRARALLDGAVSWMLAQRLDDADACYPASLSATGVRASPARSAWCYGDPGIAATLLGAARLAGVPAWEAAALEIAHIAAAREIGRCGVQDAALCHGAFGLAHIFSRLCNATGDEGLRYAAANWLEQGLAFRRVGEPLAGFPRYRHGAWLPAAGLLTGVAGIGLALLAAVSDVEPKWDRILLLDIPSRCD